MNGKSRLAILDGGQDSEKHQKTLNNYLMPFAAEKHEHDWIFKRDNVRINTSKSMKNWFLSRNVQVIDWPARSTDLDPIENLWIIMARKVYHNARQFQNVQDLTQCVMQVWEDIEERVLNLVGSMQNRCFEVMKKKVFKLKY